MVAGPVYANSSSWMSMAIETVVGTPAAAPVYWIPVKNPKLTPVITEVLDDSFRGSMVKNYQQIPTVRHDEYTFTCLAYFSTMPALFRSLLGSPDLTTGTTAAPTGTLSAPSIVGAVSVSSSVSIPNGTLIQIDVGPLAEVVTTTGVPTGAGPYAIPVPALTKAHASAVAITAVIAPFTHKIGLLNNAPLTGNQPPSYTIFDYDGYQTRQIPGCQVDEITAKFTATGLVELTVKVLGYPFVNLGSVPATNFDTVEAAPAWSGAPTINSILNTRLVDGELALKRGTKPIHTIGTTQGPYKLQVGPLELSGKLTVINTADAELNYYLNNTSFPVSLLFTPPAATVDTFTFQMTTCKAANGGQERGGDNLIVTSFDLMPMPNATDAIAGGVSPFLFTGITSQGTSY